MKHLSVKVKITIWYVLLMILMAGLLLGFLVFISGSVSTQTAMDQLDQTVRDNLQQVDMTDGSLQLGESFRFYNNGVYTLVYSQNESLLAGQVPVGFTADEPFQSGLTRPVDVRGVRYYVLDFWLPLSWEGGVWVRGILEAPENPQVVQNLMNIALVVMPLFILLAALGGYLIARLASTFNQMFTHLERSFEAEQQFTADASHELRTPVSVIKSACEYAEKYGETLEEQRETVAIIHRQANKMSTLIGQLLSITRLDQGTGVARQEQVDLADLVKTVCQEQPYPPERLFCEVQSGVRARVDSALITRLLQNLIDNGFKYGKPEGHVWVDLGRRDGEIQLTVRDDGIGIPKEQQDKVWQRFYQVDPSRSERGGAGLGLSMVWKIAQAHGGTMSLESISGLGSTFTLHLPEGENGKGETA